MIISLMGAEENIENQVPHAQSSSTNASFPFQTNASVSNAMTENACHPAQGATCSENVRIPKTKQTARVQIF